MALNGGPDEFRTGSVPSLARYGLTDSATAERQLRELGWWGERAPAEVVVPVLSSLSRTPDPDLVLHSLQRLAEALGEYWSELSNALRQDQGLRARLLGVLGCSSAFADWMVAHPELWRRLDTENFAWPGGETNTTAFLLHAVDADETGVPGTPGGPLAGVTGNAGVRALRAAYRAVLLDIAAGDLAPVVDAELPPVSYEEVAARLSDLAVAALRASLAMTAAEPSYDGAISGRLAVIAMGKCGAHELNYVSDVDVLFVAGDEEDLSQVTRLASGMMRVAGEACFQVDAALRPEGSAGALVRTLEGYRNYYRRWARTWEFQALLKARPVAGDAALGEEFVEEARPLVWTASERDGFVADVRAMRRRVEEHVPAAQAGRELKLGRGGLRDVEFAVQLLQMVHGRGDMALRTLSTLNALRALGAGGYVARTDAADLEDSYCFLRTVEHRLQLRRLRRTHLFPPTDDAQALHWLARSVGLHSSGRSGVADVLLHEFRRHANRVRRLHEKLFYRPLLEAAAKVPTAALRLTTGAAAERLAAVGYTSPEGALRHIGALTAGVSRRASIQGTLLPMLLDLLAETQDPDGGLLAYRKVSEALAETPWYLRLLRDEGVVVERLAWLLGTAKFIPELLMRAPEALRLLADTAELSGRDPNEVAASLQAAVARHADPQRAVAAARSLRRHEVLRIAAADLLGLLTSREVFRALSSVWVAVLQSALDASLRQVRERDGWGQERSVRLAVIGMGRLGGAELGYGSDADVLFVCEPGSGVSDAEAVRMCTPVVEQVRRLLGTPSQDPPLDVDADLRPEGRSGPLVRTLDSYLAYYRKWGDLWEAQALLRARPVAGDSELGERFCREIDPIRYPRDGLSEASAREIRRIKARVDSERLPRGADPATHTKLGRGGLGDVEWTVQLLQLRHAGTVESLRTTSTLDGLAAAAQAGLMSEQDATELSDAWIMAMRARNAVMLVRGKPSDQLPRQSRDLAAVASALGYPADGDPGEFLDDYLRITRRAHAVVERVFYDA